MWRVVNTYWLNKHRKRGFIYSVCETASYVYIVTNYTGSLCFKFEGQRLPINTKERHCTFKAEKKSRSRVISTHVASGGMEETWVSGDELGVQVMEDSS